MNQQTQLLQYWCEKELSIKLDKFSLLHSDASPRVYYRAQASKESWVVMDSSQEKSSLPPFVQIANSWLQAGVRVPKIVSADMQSGWLILTDFGDKILQHTLNETNVEKYYAKAMHSIKAIQLIQQGTPTLPYFDADHILTELSYFKEWFLEALLGIAYKGIWEQNFAPVEEYILQIFAEQPQVIVHRDFHSRNLMILPDDELGVIDFQDAMLGPIAYDLISLIKDCYISWNETKVLRWQKSFYQIGELHTHGITSQQFSIWCDWVSLQRHLKVLGIFSRLNLRDNKPRYMQDIPRVLNYILRVTKKYPALSDLEEGLIGIVMPRLSDCLRQFNLKMDVA